MRAVRRVNAVAKAQCWLVGEASIEHDIGVYALAVLLNRMGKTYLVGGGGRVAEFAFGQFIL